jgi:hypothetical protein
MRDAIGAAANRVAWEHAYWRAAGCARRAVAAVDVALDDVGVVRQADAWRRIDDLVQGAPRIAGCDVVIEAAGSRIDVNHASAEAIERALASIGRPDWTSPMRDRLARRNDEPIRDLGELAELAGAESRDSVLVTLDALFSIERGRVSLATAPLPVLAMVPGFREETANALVSHREMHGPISDLGQLLPLVSRTAAARLTERFPDAVRATTPDPEAWIVKSSSSAGVPTVAVEVTLRLVRSMHGVDVVAGTVSR